LPSHPFDTAHAQGKTPSCSLAIADFGRGAGGVSAEGETIDLEGISVIEREEIQIFEDDQRPFGDAATRAYLLCSPSP
jgi:hypothetical protein